MPAQSKLDVVAEIKQALNDAEGGVFLVDYRGLTVIEMATLRRTLREVGGDLRVYKNRLVNIALREIAAPNMDDLLLGPSAFVFVAEEPVASAKVLATFSKAHPALEMKGGLVQNEVLGVEQLTALSTLPSREELMAKLLGTLMNPARGTVTALAGVARGLVTVFDAIAKDKPEGPTPDPEPVVEPVPEDDATDAPETDEAPAADEQTADEAPAADADTEVEAAPEPEASVEAEDTEAA